MKNFTNLLDRLYEELKKTDLFNRLSGQKTNILFLSLGYTDKRAVVFSANKEDFGEAWNSLYRQALHYFAINSEPVEFLKLDWVDKQSTLSIPRFLKLISGTKRNHFRFGISLDKQFKLAFLEQEINANRMIQFHEKTGSAHLNPRNIKAYVTECRPGISALNLNDVQSVTIFTTESIFLEKGQCYLLKNDRLNNGRRNTALTRNEMEKLITGGMNYLANASQEDGKFTYGYDPCTDKEISGCDMRRLARALVAMSEAYELFPDERVAGTIKRGLDFLVRQGIYTDEGEGFAYVVDDAGQEQSEVTLGGAAAAILAIVKFTQVFRDETYLRVAEKLAGGIVKWQQSEGNFAHVLRFPTLDIKEPFRSGTYDTKAALALLCLYQIDKKEEWLDAAGKALDYFIRSNYWKEPDPWLGACVNEMIKVRPSRQYFKLGMDFFSNSLDVINRQETVVPGHLRLVNEGYRLLQHEEVAGAVREYADGHSLAEWKQKFEEAIHEKAEHLRNGFFYPELAIYYKNPRRVMGSFFSRDHSFLVRIDDAAHHLSAYCQYYNLAFAGAELIKTSTDNFGDEAEAGVSMASPTGKDGLAVPGDSGHEVGIDSEAEKSTTPPLNKDEEKESSGRPLTPVANKSVKTSEHKERQPSQKDSAAALPGAAAKIIAESQLSALGKIIEQQILQKAANELHEAVKQLREKDAEKTPQWTLEWKKQNQTLLETLHQSEKSVLNLTNRLNALAERVSGLTDEITALRVRMEDTEEKLVAVEEAMKLVPSEDELIKILSEQVTGMTGEISALGEKAEEKFSAIERVVKLVPFREELIQAVSEQVNSMAGKISAFHENVEAKFSAIENILKLVPLREKLIQDLKEQLTGMTGEISALREGTEAKLSALENVIKLAPLREDFKQALSEQAADLLGEIAVLHEGTEAKLSALENVIKHVPSREDFKQALSEQMKAMRGEIAALHEGTEAKLSALENVIKLVPSREDFKQALSEQVKYMTGEIAAFREKTEDNFAALEKAIQLVPSRKELMKALTEKVTVVKGEISALREDTAANIAALEKAVQLVPSREELIKALSEQAADLTGEITALRKDTEAKFESIKDAMKLVPSREEFTKTLSEQVSKLNSEMTSLRKEAAAKLAELENVVKLVPSGLALIKELSEQVSGLTEAIAALGQETKKRLEAVEQVLKSAPPVKEGTSEKQPEKIVEGLIESGELKELIKEVVHQLLVEGLIAPPPPSTVPTEKKPPAMEEIPGEEQPAEEKPEELPQELPPVRESEEEEAALTEEEAERQPEEEESRETAKPLPPDESVIPEEPILREEGEAAEEAPIPEQPFEPEKEEQHPAALTAVAEPEKDVTPEAEAPLEEKKRRKKILRILGNVLMVIGLVVIGYFAYDVLSMKFGEQKALKEAESKVSLDEKEYQELKDIDLDDPNAPEKLVEMKKEVIDNFAPKYGEAFAILEIPKLNKKLPILEGTDAEVLEKGVGHLKQSVFPGQGEQIVISGHRDTVFRNFDKLKKGDLFIIHMPYGTYTYEFRDYEIVGKDDTSVVRKMGEEVLVVTTCYPFRYIGNAPKRFVVYAYPVENKNADK